MSFLSRPMLALSVVVLAALLLLPCFDYIMTHVTACPQIDFAKLGPKGLGGNPATNPFPFEQTRQEAYARFVKGKRVLAVGGTKGIGRGIVEQAVKAGAASVTVVGRTRSAFEDILAESTRKGSFKSDTQELNFVEGDMASIRGSLGLVQRLAEESLGAKPFDIVALTVGVWPNLSDPLSTDGYNRALQIDFIARHIVLMGLNDSGLLHRDNSSTRSTVINVLSSSRRIPLKPRMPDEALMGHFQVYQPAMLAQYSSLHWIRGLFEVASSVCDVWLNQAAKALPHVTFVGSFPGLVKSDLTKTLVGETLQFLLTNLPIGSMPLDENGDVHLGMVAAASAVVQRQLSKDEPQMQDGLQARNAVFMDHHLYVREGAELDRAVFGNWLWEFLEVLRK